MPSSLDIARTDYSVWADKDGNPTPNPTLTAKQRRERQREQVEGVLEFGGVVAIGVDSRGQQRWAPEGSVTGIASLGWTEAKWAEVMHLGQADQLRSDLADLKVELGLAKVQLDAKQQSHDHLLKVLEVNRATAVDEREDARVKGLGYGLMLGTIVGIVITTAVQWVL